MDRRTKETVVAELHDRLKNARIAVLAAYSGLNVETMTSLRNALRRSDTELRVVKNTLLRIASEDTDIKALEDHIKGPLAIVLGGGDVVEPSKILVDFAKNDDKPSVKVGVIDGKMIDIKQVKQLALLPSREVLLSQLLSAMQSPISGLVGALSGIIQKFVGTVDAIAKQKEGK